jgi:hypothetical protein
MDPNESQTELVTVAVASHTLWVMVCVASQIVCVTVSNAAHSRCGGVQTDAAAAASAEQRRVSAFTRRPLPLEEAQQAEHQNNQPG